MAQVSSFNGSGVYIDNDLKVRKDAKANIASAQTDSSVVAAVAAKKIRVLAFIISSAATATSVTFNSKPAGAGVAISATFISPANSGYASGFNPLGWFETVAAEGLTVTTGTGSTTGVQVQYVEV